MNIENVQGELNSLSRNSLLSKVVLLSVATTLIVGGLFIFNAGIAFAADCSGGAGSSTIIAEFNQQMTNNPDSTSYDSNNWATDTNSRNIKIWKSSVEGTYCGQTSDNGTFITNGNVSPNSTVPAKGIVDGTFTGGAIFSIVGDPSDTPTLTDSSWILGQHYTDWIAEYFDTGVTFSWADYTWTYTSSLGEIYVANIKTNTGDIHSIVNSYTHIGYPTIQSAIDTAISGETIVLGSDITITAQININKPITIDGAGHKINASFQRVSNDNNSALGIIATADVTIKNLIVDGTGGSAIWPLQLHGINVYHSNKVTLDKVSMLNFGGSGINISGSVVTTNDLNTSGNVWDGVDVDKGSNDFPAKLTVNGVSTQSDTFAAIYVDDNSNGNVSVVDTNNQYTSSLYTHDISIIGTKYVLTSTIPVITLTGINPVTITQGNVYTDAGATATDNVDTNVTVSSTGTVDTNTVGVYTITYSAKDVSGNIATPVTRTINVVAPVQNYGGGGGGYSAPVVTPTSTITSGCDARTTGFSTTTGKSCLGNTGTAPTAGQVLGAQSFNFTLFLKNGSKGNEVTELQKFLNAASYNTGTADGKFGSKTKTALIKFQVANKLNGDGIVGPKVRALLNQ